MRGGPLRPPTVPRLAAGSSKSNLSPSLKRMVKKKGRLYKKAKKKRSRRSHYLEFERSTKRALKQAHWQHVNGILTSGLEEGDSKPFWGYIKSMRQDSQGISPLKSGAHLLTDPYQKAQLLSDQFSSVFTDDNTPEADNMLHGPQYPPIRPLEVSEPGVRKLLRNLNPGKAAGPDEIPARILKELADDLSPAITALLNKSLDSGVLPSTWKDAWVTPIFKKGTRNDPANYRPVSLTSIICKVAEHIICSHVRDHLDEHQILSDANHGFRQGHSCETQLLLTTHDLLKHHDRRHQVDVGILDFSKAFDTEPHRRLISKLRLYGIDGRILLWIQAFLSDRRQLVLCDGVKSQFAPVTSGVPQGTVLGPLLFLLHINDLPSVVDPNTSVRLFADDALVYRVINTIQDQVTLQQDFARLEGWAKAWGMVFNASKCYVMHIHRGNSTKSYFYQICGEFLSPVTNEKYLGVHITQDLSWSLHIDRVATKASQKLGFIRRNLRGAPAQCKQLAYIALVRSGMEYASTIWDPHINVHSNKLEKIQRKAARWATSQYSHRTSVTSLMDQLKWQPLEDRRRIQRLAFLYKILHHKVAVPMSSIDLVYNSRPARGKDKTKADFRSHEHLLNSLRNPLAYRLLRTGTLCRNLPSQRLKALKHYSRASCPGPTRNCTQPVGFMSHRTLRLSSRSRSRSRESGPEVLKREQGHVFSESGVSEVAVFRALQPNVPGIYSLVSQY